MDKLSNIMLYISYECRVPNGFIQTSRYQRDGTHCERRRNIPENLLRGLRYTRAELLKYCRSVGEPYLNGFITDIDNRESIIRKFENTKCFYHYEVKNRLVPGLKMIAKQLRQNGSDECPDLEALYASLRFEYSCIPFSIPDNFKETVIRNNAALARDVLLRLNTPQRPNMAEVTKKIFMISSSFRRWQSLCPDCTGPAIELQKIASSFNEYSDLSLLMSELGIRLAEIILWDKHFPPENIPLKAADWVKPSDNYEDCPLFKGLDL